MISSNSIYTTFPLGLDISWQKIGGEFRFIDYPFSGIMVIYLYLYFLYLYT